MNTPQSAVEKGTIVQLGPGLGVRGGVSAVERLIVEQLGNIISIRHISTMEEGSVLLKLRVFLRAIVKLAAALRTRDELIVHIHFASRGSSWRKMFLAWMTLRARRPLILHAHGGGFAQFYKRLPRPLRLLLKRIFQQADRLVVLSLG